MRKKKFHVFFKVFSKKQPELLLKGKKKTLVRVFSSHCSEQKIFTAFI